VSQRWMNVPEHVTADPEASEGLRVCTVRDGQIFSVRVERWDDPAAWGMLLADLARHIARSYAEAGARTEPAAFQRVIAGFRAELPVGDA